MARDFISKATRNAFREVLVGFVLREIDMFFEGAGLSCNSDYDAPVGGQRRSLVEQYYAAIDFRSHDDVEKLVSAYGEIVLAVKSDNFSAGTEDDLLRRMKREGYDFDGEAFLRPGEHHSAIERIRKLAAARDLPGLTAEIERLSQAAEDDPPLAVGTAKDLVESICKTILEDRGIQTRGKDLPQLVRSAMTELSLLPDNILDQARGADVIRRVLNSLNQVSQGIAELRNLYGTGHGRDGRFVGIQPRHARLVVGTATTLGMFLLETDLERRTRPGV